MIPNFSFLCFVNIGVWGSIDGLLPNCKMTRTVFIYVIGVLALSVVSHAADRSKLAAPLLIPDQPSRLVKLTAHLRVKNANSTAVSRYIFRVTMPPDLHSQRAVLAVSDVLPVSRRQHKNGANEYLEFDFPVPANEEVVKDVTFLVLLMPIDYSLVENIQGRGCSTSDALDRYLKPSHLIESDSGEIKETAAVVFSGLQNELDKARAAYEFPAKILKFEEQTKPLGAQRALQTKIGDCTEYACLFSALCRTQAIPARLLGVFNMGSRDQISAAQPNHNIAEVYLASHGWIPVDPNLGAGRYDGPIGFGKFGNTVIILTREGSWVWATALPRDAYSQSLPKPKLMPGISWDAKVVKEGSAEDLWHDLFAAKQQRH